MKKRIVLWVVLVLIGVIGFRAAPGMVASSVPSIYYVTPSVKTYENVVTCSGTVHSQNVQEIYPQSAFVAGEVLVSVGDLVREEEPLIRVEAPGAAVSIPGADSSAIGQDLAGIDIGALISAYGISSLLGLDMDMGDLSALLGGGAEQGAPAATSASVVAVQEEILAPISGVVTELSVVEGMPVSSGKALLTITDTGSYKVLASVDEGDIAKIQLGDAAKIRGVGFSGSVYRGVVSKIYPTARKALSGASSETVVDVEITLENPDANLRPGFSAKVEISGGVSRDIVTVPYEAVRQDENNNEYVYTYREGKLEKTTILTGQEMTSEVEVLEGLAPDSVVIYNPDDVAGEGAIIQIKGRADVD